ncbi:hypothetical protein AB0I72_05645 [Nocardiopsis sp. NPDC049922]|uniref:hypothetical protein n=1 Tax=Nocardiopsis sp. NPDC049922 TaxID=3155157 RepID=UPI0033F7FAEB
MPHRFTRALVPVALMSLALATTGAASDDIGWTEAHVIDKDVFVQHPLYNDIDHWPWTVEPTKVYCAVDAIGIRFAGPPHVTFLLHRANDAPYPSDWEIMEPGYKRLPAAEEGEGEYIPLAAYTATAIDQCDDALTRPDPVAWTEAHVIDKDVFTQAPHENDVDAWPWTSDIAKVYCAVDAIGIRFAYRPHTTFLLHRVDNAIYPSYWQTMEPGYKRLPATGQGEGEYVPTDAYLATAIDECGEAFTGPVPQEAAE